jgi:hypothetical protein
MRQAFNIAVAILLTFLVTERAIMRTQAAEKGAVTCTQGADLVRLEALGRGFSEAVSSSQKENFLSGCLVTGRGQVGNLVARD